MKLLLLFLFASCGIIETQKEIISIDTIPSGLEVYRRKDKSYVGKTPLFTQTKKNSQVPYIFKYNGQFSSISETAKEYCHYRRMDKNPHLNDKTHRDINDVFDVLNPVTLVNGAKFECVQAVRANVNTKAVLEDQCKTLVAIFPKSKFMETSLEIYNEYKKQIFDPQKKACDKLISPFQAEEYFSFLGIDHLFPPENLEEMDSEKIFKIGYKFKATHIVFLPHEEKESLLKVTPKIYNIHEGTAVDGALSKSYSLTPKEMETHWVFNFLLSSFRLIPNGLGILASTENKFEVTDSQQNQTSYKYDDFELGITFDDIQYPAQKWAFNFRTVPVLFFTGWGDQVDLKLSGLTLDFKLYIHLPPGGVFVARAGLGGAYIDIDYPAENYNSGGLSFITDVGIEFYFFPADRIYASLGYKKYFLPNDSVTFGAESITGQSHVFFELGYFWPELRMGARSLFL